LVTANQKQSSLRPFFAFAVACPFVCHAAAKRRNLLLRLRLLLPLPVLLFVIPQRSEGICGCGCSCSCRCLPFCLSFRSEAEESAVAVAVALAVAYPFCLSFRSEVEESAATFPPSSLPLAGCQSIIDKNNVLLRGFGSKDERTNMPALKAVLRPFQEHPASSWAGNMDYNRQLANVDAIFNRVLHS